MLPQVFMFMTHLTSNTETTHFERYRGSSWSEDFSNSRPLPAHIRVNTLKIRVEQARVVARGYELER
jgi:hypothetical protein